MNAIVSLIIVCLAFSAHGLPASQIIGGNNALNGFYPYQASLRNLQTNIHFCGGTIISKNYIITAGHCIKQRIPSNVLVALGSNYLDTPRAVYPAAAFIQHPNYKKSVNDIGLIRVLQDIEFNELIQPIALPIVDRNYDGYSLLVTGWGRLWTGGPDPNNLQEIVVKGYSQEKCNHYYKNIIMRTHICTLTVQGEGMCNGDSGGPLVADGVLVGIVSFGQHPCGSGSPDVYTRVFYYRDWINFHTGI